MAYLLDANVFIAANNQHYGMDFCPAFWEWLPKAHSAGHVFSIESVRRELLDPKISEWAASLDRTFFLQPDESVFPHFAEVSEWVTTKYDPAGATSFLDSADYFLIAQAKAGGHTVVTHERPDNSTKRVKIPNVCIALKVPGVSPFHMLREQMARFVLPR